MERQRQRQSLAPDSNFKDLLAANYGGDQISKYAGHFSQWGPKRPQHSVYNSPPSPRPRSRSRKTAAFKKCAFHPVSLVCSFVLVTFGLSALVGAMVALSFYGDGSFYSKGKPNITYGPGDTQNLFLSRLLCEQLSPKSDSLYSDDYLFSYLYILDREPSLADSVNVSFEDEFVIFDKHWERDFHFYPGTVIDFEVCASKKTYSGFGSFYLVKGLAAYDEWDNSEEEGSIPPLYEGYVQVANYCGSGEQQTFSYYVTDEDQYYFIFINHQHINPYPATLVVNYTIQRTLYDVDPISVIDSCRFSTMPCSVNVPFATSRAAVLVYGDPDNWGGQWENSAIKVHCSPRIWVYTAATAGGVLVITMCMLCLCLSLCCCSCYLTEETDEADTPLLRSNPVDEKARPMGAKSRELKDPSRDDFVNRSVPTSPKYVEIPGSHAPPSFKKSDKFSLGSPTVETFKTRA